jgi:hypothetical protein
MSTVHGVRQAIVSFHKCCSGTSPLLALSAGNRVALFCEFDIAIGQLTGDKSGISFQPAAKLTFPSDDPPECFDWSADACLLAVATRKSLFLYTVCPYAKGLQ